MTHIVVEACIGEKSLDCVDVCPVDCFAEGDDMLYIDPEECIDCQQCVPACPVDAIFAEDDLPEDQTKWTQLNADFTANTEDRMTAS